MVESYNESPIDKNAIFHLDSILKFCYNFSFTAETVNKVAAYHTSFAWCNFDFSSTFLFYERYR